MFVSRLGDMTLNAAHRHLSCMAHSICRCFHNNHNFPTEPGAHRTDPPNSGFSGQLPWELLSTAVDTGGIYSGKSHEGKSRRISRDAAEYHMGTRVSPWELVGYRGFWNFHKFPRDPTVLWSILCFLVGSRGTRPCPAGRDGERRLLIALIQLIVSTTLPSPYLSARQGRPRPAF